MQDLQHSEDDPAVALIDALFEMAPALHTQMQAGLAERGLSLSRAVLLWQVAADGPVIQRDLARTLQVVPRTVTGIVDDLTAAGLLARTPHPHDRRALLVSLTDDGRQLIAKLSDERAALAAQLCAGLDVDDLRAAAATVAELAGRLHAATAGPPAAATPAAGTPVAELVS
jgi:DNA-binding MarR family transcriptional regulator